MQVIPSDWVDLAFERYDQGIDRDEPMTVLAVDVAQGGKDRTVLQPLHGRRFETNIVRKGTDTKDGADVGSLIIRERRDNAMIVVDCTGGWGGDTVGFLKRETIFRSKMRLLRPVGRECEGQQDPVLQLARRTLLALARGLAPQERARAGNPAVGDGEGAVDGASLEDAKRKNPD